MTMLVDPCNFGERFIASKGRPLEHGGKTVVMLDQFPCEQNEPLIVTIESTDSDYLQGVGISEGVEVFGEVHKKAVVFEHYSLPSEEREVRKSNLPFSFIINCRNKKGFLSFYNITLVNGRQAWWHGGSAMVVEEMADGRRYHCNDFELDDDFDDIVFTVKQVTKHKDGKGRS